MDITRLRKTLARSKEHSFDEAKDADVDDYSNRNTLKKSPLKGIKKVNEYKESIDPLKNSYEKVNVRNYRNIGRNVRNIINSGYLHDIKDRGVKVMNCKSVNEHSRSVVFPRENSVDGVCSKDSILDAEAIIKKSLGKRKLVKLGEGTNKSFSESPCIIKTKTKANNNRILLT
eukprot:TRINITY_DN15745_c0_g1_i4.p1 TRINITY_DN15745_c0_g1~~TRINITY_DN15745_c0_g1_i4.p1  ORF type:complete len:173 (+),score=21.11 TRINITY_DN15745_c0_g1_i4:194-712(+)